MPRLPLHLLHSARYSGFRPWQPPQKPASSTGSTLFSKVPAFLDWYQKEIGYFPLWCVPYKRVHDYEWIDDHFYAGMQDALFLDLAIYGLEQDDDRNIHRMIEEKLRELGGIKTLISHNYYSRDEFWSIWNKRNYDQVKAVTDPRNVFRDLYTKTCRAAMGLPG